MNTLTLALLAEKTMDLYYQDLKAQDDFFDLDDFKFYISVAYAAQLQEEYEKSYKQNMAELGIGSAALNPEWFVPEEVDVKRNPKTDQYEATIAAPPFTFRFDRSFSSVATIEPVKGTCQEFVKSNQNRNFFRKGLPVTSKVYWYPTGGRKLVFKNVQCALSKVRVYYIPSLTELNDETPLSESMGEPVLKRTLELMLAARNGMLIDKTEDQNRNKTPETEISQAFSKGKT